MPAPPLMAGGHKLGTLCVIDDTPRSGFDAREAETLTQLARLVVDELELRREAARRERAEAELRDRSRLLNLAEEIGQFGHWYVDFVTDRRRWSDEVYRIMGLTPQAGPPTVEMSRAAYHPDDLPRLAELVERARTGGEGFSVEARVIRPDGDLRHVFIRGMTEAGPDGRPVGLMGVVQDITEAKREEAELRSNRELLDLTVQATRDGIWDWALDTNTIWFSPTWKEQLGYRDDELENSLEMWAGLIFEEDRIAALETVRAYNAGRIPNFEMVQRFRHKQGHTVYILSRAIHIRDASGQVVRMVGAHTDITRDKKSEEELRLAKQTLDDAIEAVPEGLAYFDADDRLILCNERYREAHPRTAPLLTPGRPFEAILRLAIANGEFAGNPEGATDEAWIQAELAQHRNPGPPFERELPDGRWILVAENRTSSGALVCTRTDITERKRFEAELQRQGCRHVRAGRGAGRRPRGGRRAARPGGGGDPGQVGVPGGDEPRDPHADERHHGHDRTAVRHPPDGGAAPVRPGHPQLVQRPADHHQPTSWTSPSWRPAASPSRRCPSIPPIWWKGWWNC